MFSKLVNKLTLTSKESLLVKIDLLTLTNKMVWTQANTLSLFWNKFKLSKHKNLASKTKFSKRQAWVRLSTKEVTKNMLVTKPLSGVNLLTLHLPCTTSAHSSQNILNQLIAHSKNITHAYKVPFRESRRKIFWVQDSSRSILSLEHLTRSFLTKHLQNIKLRRLTGEV